ncbi:MAG: 50S ribosomal protein L32 [Phycisphaeraceae bacterium]
MLPKQRISRTRGRIRRSHDALTPRAAIACPNCGAAKLPHAACTECGYVRPGLKVSVGRLSQDD